MKIELKNVKFSEHLSEETNAFTADIYVNGVKAGYAKNSGQGGCTDCRAHFEHRDLFAQAEKYLSTLPPTKLPGYTFELESNMENLVDELFEKWLKEQANKKVAKKMESAIIILLENGNMNLISWPKRKLSEVPLQNLQAVYDKTKNNLKPREEIINTNLEKLGVKL